MSKNTIFNLLLILPMLFAFTDCGNKNATKEEEKTTETVQQETATKTENNKKETSVATGTVSVTANGETYSGNTFDKENELNSSMYWISVKDEAKVNTTIFPSTPQKIQVSLGVYKLNKGNTNLSGSYAVSKSDSDKSQASIGAKVFSENGELIIIALEEGTLQISQMNDDGIVKVSASGKGFFGVTPSGNQNNAAMEGKTLEEIAASGALDRYVPKNDVPVSFSVDVKIPKDRVMIQNY